MNYEGISGGERRAEQDSVRKEKVEENKEVRVMENNKKEKQQMAIKEEVLDNSDGKKWMTIRKESKDEEGKKRGSPIMRRGRVGEGNTAERGRRKKKAGREGITINLRQNGFLATKNKDKENYGL